MILALLHPDMYAFQLLCECNLWMFYVWKGVLLLLVVYTKWNVSFFVLGLPFLWIMRYFGTLAWNGVLYISISVCCLSCAITYCNIKSISGDIDSNIFSLYACQHIIRSMDSIPLRMTCVCSYELGFWGGGRVFMLSFVYCIFQVKTMI